MFCAVSLLGRLGALQVIADAKKPLSERPEFSRNYSGSLLTRKIRLQKPIKRAFFLPKNDCNKRAILTRNLKTNAVSTSAAVESLYQILTEALKGIEPGRYSSLPKPNLPFDSDSYIGNIFQLAKTFVNSNRFRDEKRARVAVLTGISGIGKTQFSMELPYLLRQACEHPDRINYLNTDGLQSLAPPSDAPVNHRSASRLMSEEMSDRLAEETFEDKVQSFKEALSKNCKRIYIDWSKSVQSYDERIEQNWSSSVRLGLRVAAQHWFPNTNFEKVRERMKDSPHLNEFTLTNVLDAMYSEEKTLSAVYIILDGFHACTCRFEVPSESPDAGTATELLSRSLSRALISAARAQEKFFVFGAMVAHSITNEDFVPDDAFIYAPVPRLSNQSVKNIILRSELLRTKPSDWLGMEGFDIILRFVGGIPRSVQILVEKMRVSYKVPSSVHLAHILFENYKDMNNVDALFGRHSSEVWPILLGASGYNVAPLKMFQVNRTAKRGYFSRVESPWRSIWLKCHAAVRPSDPMLVMDIPFPTLEALSMFGYVEIHCPDTAYTFPSAEANYLRDLLGLLVDAAYSNIDESILIHLLLRWNIFNFADNSNCIFAADLFVGGLFDRTFGKRKFAKEKTVIGLPRNPLKGVWATTTTARSVRSSVELMYDKSVIKFSDMSPDKRGVFFGSDNLFSGHVRLWIEEGDKKLPAIIWLDTKHATSNTELTLKDIDEVVKKRKFLERKLPQYIHLSIIYSNHDYSGDEPEDSNTCIVSKEGMSFSMSPMMKWLLTENRQP